MGVEITPRNLFGTFEDNNFGNVDVGTFNIFAEDMEIFNTFEDNNTFEDSTITEEDCYILVDENGEYVVDGEVDDVF